MTKGILTFLIKDEDSLVILKDNIFHFGKVTQIGLNSSKIILKFEYWTFSHPIASD